MENQDQPFLLRWSLKRKSKMDVSFEQSNVELYDQSFTDVADFLHLKATNDQNFIDQNVATNEPAKETTYAKQIPLVEEKASFYVQTERKGLPAQGDKESPSVAAKKMKFEETNEINQMDVDTPSENIFLNKNLDEIFKEKLDELMALEQKLSEWLDGTWLPSKDDALQLLTSSLILKQQFLDMCTNTTMTDKIKNALELSRMLVRQIKDSISECDACSLELMDYDTCSWAIEKMSIESSGTGRGANHPVDWTLNSGIKEIPACEWSSNVNIANFSKSSTSADPSRDNFSESSAPENLCPVNFPQNLASAPLSQESCSENSASANVSQEDDQSNSDVPDDVLHELDPAARAAKVKAIRAVLLPHILDMLDNYDEWSEAHHNDVMCEFLDMKHEEMRRQKRSVDDNRAASEKQDFSARGSAIKYHNVKPK